MGSNAASARMQNINMLTDTSSPKGPTSSASKRSLGSLRFDCTDGGREQHAGPMTL